MATPLAGGAGSGWAVLAGGAKEGGGGRSGKANEPAMVRSSVFLLLHCLTYMLLMSTGLASIADEACQ